MAVTVTTAEECATGSTVENSDVVMVDMVDMAETATWVVVEATMEALATETVVEAVEVMATWVVVETTVPTAAYPPTEALTTTIL